MLTHLQIRDFAIIEHLELDLAPGMTAMTGETGAGKSILVDALGLLLGDRADSSAVRSGSERADLCATFDLSRLPTARQWLKERDLDEGEECLIRRVISQSGRSRNYLNGTPQPLQSLKELGEMLLDIHGQHEHQSLLRRELQRQILDDYAGHQAQVAQLDRRYREINHLERRLKELHQARGDRDARLDLLRYQVQELEALNLQPGELAQLEEEHLRLANAGQLLETAQKLLDLLYENEEVSATGLVGHAQGELEGLLGLDARLNPVQELLGGAAIQLQEACDELRHYAQDIDLDPARLNWLEQRLAAIQTLARKHRCEPGELPALLESLQVERGELEGGEERGEELERQRQRLEHQWLEDARDLGARRQQAADQLADGVSQAMHGLGMPKGRFRVELTTGERPAPGGLETVEFMVCANPGQPLRPLARVASGGELSRISLAIQVIIAHSARVPTMVFDEVDTGIGGGVAEVVGRLLRRLGDSRQVLCVTHLPQVAAQAHRHLRVSKDVEGPTTRTGITALEADDRVGEIARMLGGLQLTDNTLAHAREMIEHAQGAAGS